MVKLKKLSEARSLIKDNMCANFCEDDVKTYLHYIDKDIDELEDYKRCDMMLDDCTIGHLFEELYLLQDLIKIIMREGDE